MLVAASTRVLAGIERRRDSFSFQDKDVGILRAERSWLNWSCAAAPFLGWTAGELDQMQACFTQDFSGGSCRS
jgi:hypothetical protein